MIRGDEDEAARVDLMHAFLGQILRSIAGEFAREL